MTVITDISLPADQFALGQLFNEYPDIAIELVRVIPLRDGIIPLFWIDGGDPEEIEATLRANSLVEEAVKLSEAGGRYLFEMKWSLEIDGLVQPMIESNAEVLQAEGTVDRWEFRLQFPNREQLADFRERSRDNDIQFELDALYNPVTPGEAYEEGDLTADQFDILATAHENGYWHIPRDIELGEVADLIGISPNAASQRMRRALDTLVGQAIAKETN